MNFESSPEAFVSLVAPSRYETIAPIGRGGMAEVFLSVMVGAGGIAKLAVLKRIWPELATDPIFLAMFLDEARLSVRMAHPNLVQTYEVIEEDDGLAIAMEYLDGQPLGRAFTRLSGTNVLSLPQRVRIITKLLAGLDYAHELTDYDGTPLSVVHRDVSPQNVFITYDGSVKLVDFGVSKSVADAHDTRPGTLKGKFSYMAPELFQGQVADRRADIFAVGVILWEMLAVRRFWSGVADNQIAAYLLSDRPLPSLPAELGLPIELEEICSRALSRDPDRRYATAAEMEADLDDVLTRSHETSDRLLGKAVADGFAAERAERQALIDRHLRKIRSGSYPLRSGSYPVVGGGYATPSASLPPVSIPGSASSKRFRWSAAGVFLALPVLVLAAVLLGRGAMNHRAPPAIQAPPQTAMAGRVARSAPPTSSRPREASVAPPRDVAAERRNATEPRRSTRAEGPKLRPAEIARRERDRRSSAPPAHRDGPRAMTAAPAPSLVAPASRPDFAAGLPRASAQPRPIDMTSPFPQRSGASARPINNMASPGTPRAAPPPRYIETTNPFLPKGAPPPSSEAE